MEGMLKTQKTIKNSTNFTIPNGAVIQAAIKEKQAKKAEKKTAKKSK